MVQVAELRRWWKLGNFFLAASVFSVKYERRFLAENEDVGKGLGGI